MILDKSQILKEIKLHYRFEKDSDFARFLGITSQNLSNWYNRKTFNRKILYTKCLDINPEWLLTGKGEMLKANKELNTYTSEVVELLKSQLNELKSQLLEKEKKIDELNKELIKLNREIGILQGKLGKDKSSERNFALFLN
ncbi:MAG: helix-turn-helix domain-containing protein [Prevotellaceae bacterium]|jgi:phage repressor protein C with HTH and peptisase S24 domain|nr:helix-turn-helix domain-containing protein [Prevotellaceae bacterium]